MDLNIKREALLSKQAKRLLCVKPLLGIHFKDLFITNNLIGPKLPPDPEEMGVYLNFSKI